jgi:prevent-host-death family protein
MTNTDKPPTGKPGNRSKRNASSVATRDAKSGQWLLRDAKARFSEVVRRVRSDGPQHVTVHGRDEVVIMSAEEFRRLKGDETGKALVDAMQASPHRDIDIEPKRGAMPVRDVVL